jgi:hypothetical protein
MNIQRWLAVAVIGPIAAVLVMAALAGLFQVAALVWRGRRTTATVVADTGPVGSPKFRFTDEEGQTHLVSKAVVSVQRALGAGQRVSLIYLPGHPETFVLDRFADKWGFLLLVFLVGLIPLFICLVLVFHLEQAIMDSGFFAPLLCLTVGGFFSALAFPAVVKTLRFRGTAVETVATITAAQRGGIWPAIERDRMEGVKALIELPETDAGEPEPWILSVEFEDATGAKRRGFAEVSRPAAQRAYEVGDPVPILYEPQRPWDAQTDTFLTWFGPLLVAGFAAALLIVGLFWLSVRILR